MYIVMTEDLFSYEVQALVKAFFPAESTKLVIAEQMEGKDGVFINIQESLVTVTYVEDGKEISKSENTFDRTQHKRRCKDSVKQAIYKVLEQVTGHGLPWGTLTGVRPSKLVMELVEEGMPKDEVLKEMETRYLCSSERAELGYQIVSTEKRLLDQIDYKNSYSVYIGIPFCPTTCLYCSFTSYAIRQYSSFVENYLEALFKEIEYAASCIKGKKLATVYIGGGTPTTLDAGQLKRLLQKVKECFDFSYVKEFTVEAGRPDSITKDKLLVLKEMGVSRISINPQTMNQKTLDIIGRHHTVEAVKETFQMAREVGLDNINMDLIVGLPNESTEDVALTLDEISKLNPDSITVHSLVLKRAAMLNMEKSKYGSFTFGNVDEMIGLGKEFAKANDMAPYYMYRQKNTTGSHNSSRENVGYAKEGKEGLYNILIMEEKHTILALGAGASSKFVFPTGGRIERIENVKSVKDYVERIDEMIQRKKDFIEGDYNVVNEAKDGECRTNGASDRR